MAEPTGAAFGIYPSSGRRPERLNQSRNVNAPLQLARGWAAGLLGLPGDIEGLVRLLPGIKDETPVLPTSDFYREYLPGYDPRPAARAMSGLGALTGGAGATSVVRGGLGAVKRATDLNAIRDYVRSAQGLSGLPGTAVVKPKGGNWISGIAGSPEESVRGLKSSQAYVGMRPGQLEAANTSDAALNSWIDQKLAKYIRNEMGTPEDPLRAQVEAFPARRAELLAAKDAQLAKARADMERAQAARGVAPEVLTQSQARIRDLERERALIEPLTGLHFTPENVYLPPDVAKARVMAGYPEEGLAKSQLATDWETLADAPISTMRAGKLAPQFSGSDPWLAKVPPETPVYGITPGDTIRNQNLGFGHLVDELRNAVRAGSDLPAELRLTPEQLGKMNVPAAAAHVDRVNAWRAAQKAEADLARAGNAATVEYKTYDTVPGTALPNERGLRWVELKVPTNKSMPEDEYTAGIEKLSDALKYEGETMGHCVGGYCPDVMEGRSRIFSLRDAKGQPHVTVEVKPMSDSKFQRSVDWKTYRQLQDENPESASAWLAEQRASSPADIIQIKGKANKAPKDEYLPYVQDFVRSGRWGQVEDLDNAKLMTHKEAFGHLYSIDPKLADIFADNTPVPEGYFSLEDLDRLSKPGARVETKGGSGQGYARGGAVRAPAAGPLTYDPDRIAALAEQLTMEA